MHRSRLVTLVLMLLAGASPFALAAPASAATTVVIPPGPWAGDLGVQVTSDAPYLYYRLVAQGETVTRVFANTASGSQQTVTVPTWGLGESGATTANLGVGGCTTADASSCTPAGSGNATLQQTQPVDITLETPASPVIIPDQHVYATVHQGTAGPIRLGGVAPFTGSEQTLPDGVRTEVSMIPLQHAQVARWYVLRCNPVVTSVCGQRDGEGMTQVDLVHDLTISATTSETYVNPDPAASDGTTQLRLGLTGVTQQLTWSLVASGGRVAAGPVSTTVNGSTDLDITPGANANGTLSPGSYTLRVTTSVTGTAASRSATTTAPLRVSTTPPPDTVSYQHVSGPVRPGRAVAGIEVAQTHWQRQDHAILVIRNHLGQLVHRQTQPFVDPGCDTDGDCYHPYGFTWDGRSDAGVTQPANRYHVYAYLVDHDAQTLKVDMGMVTIQKLVTRTVTTARREPFTDRLHATAFDDIGRCSRLQGLGAGRGFDLESLVLNCPAPAQPNDDRVWMGVHSTPGADNFSVTDPGFDRLMKLRLRVYGDGGAAGDTMAAAVQDSADRTSDSFTALPGTFSGTTPHWQYSGWFTANPATLGTRRDPTFRLQVAGGSSYDARFLQATYTYRSWVNP